MADVDIEEIAKQAIENGADVKVLTKIIKWMAANNPGVSMPPSDTIKRFRQEAADEMNQRFPGVGLGPESGT
jgi:hypothetical protein